MVREEKIKIMTKLAILEQDQGDMIKKAKTYYRSDFIGGHLLKNIFLYTAAFLIGFILWASYSMDALLEKLNTMDILGLGRRIILVYGIVLVIYLVLSYVIYYIKFHKAEIKLLSYRLLMDRLIEEYDKEYADGEVTGSKRKTDRNIRKVR